MTGDDDETEMTTPPRKRTRRGIRANYAELYRDLRRRQGHARDLLIEAADAEPSVAKALINVALRTLSEE